MSGLMDKAKDKLSGSKGAQDKVNDYTHKGIDSATDKAGLGDKYDSKINTQADKQVKNQLSNQGGSGGTK